MPMRRKSRARVAKIESDDDEFSLSDGDLVSDLDFDAKAPLQQSAAMPKAKLDVMRASGIGSQTRPA